MADAREARCYCCGGSYPWGEWRCCAPPVGMRSEIWMARYCAPVEKGGCGKCERHCGCVKPVRETPQLAIGEDIREQIARLAQVVLRSME